MGIKVIKDSKLSSAQLASLVDTIHDLATVAPGTKIMVQGESTEAALYLIREGKVKITRDEGESRLVGTEGYFGEELLLVDKKLGGDGGERMPQNDLLRQPTTTTARFTVEAVEPCIVGTLTLQSCRCILDTTTLGRYRRPTLHESMDLGVSLEDLRKLELIGAGTFGQVWLVVKENAEGEAVVPYALKIQSKYELTKQNSAAGAVRERKVMSELHHPFLLTLVNAFQDENFLYMVMGFVQGGELLGRMEDVDYEGLPESETVFYAACIFEALTYCHSRGIVFRDLKPENVLIDAEGYTTLVDFGFGKTLVFSLASFLIFFHSNLPPLTAKRIVDKTYTFLGTPLYMAPEIILNLGHGPAADNWSWGVLIYELCTGDTPFYVDGMDQIGLFKSICRGHVNFSVREISGDVRLLLEEVLVLEPKHRIGSFAEGEKEIANHAWFKGHGIDWDRLRKKEITAPWVPDLSEDPLDTSNFEDCDHLTDKTELDMPQLSPEQDAVFDDF